MVIKIDTNKGHIIVPATFFTQLARINRILADGGSDKKWTAEEYVKDQFERAIQKPLLRPGDPIED